MSGAFERLGQDLATWRTLRRLTVAEVADWAGLGESTVVRLESDRGAGLENVLRVARALGVLEKLVASVAPYSSEVGGWERMRRFLDASGRAGSPDGRPGHRLARVGSSPPGACGAV